MMRRAIEKNIITNRNFLILIITILGMLPVLLSVGGLYVKSDITAQMLPFLYETKRMFASGVPLWSWNTYFGDNFIASYTYYTVFNPFTWINCLFPYEFLRFGFTLVLYLKFLACGYVSQKYLKKIGFDEKLSLIGCLLYTFSSWAISNLYYYMFMEPMILFPFLLIFVERFLRKERHAYTGLAMATFIVVAVNYYFAPVNLIAATFYFFCRLCYLWKDGENRFFLTLKAVCFVFLGIMSSSMVLVPVLMQLKGSPHESLNFNYSDIFKIADKIFWLFYPKAHEGRFYYILLNSEWKSNAASIALFGLLPSLLLFFKKGYGWIKCLTALMLVIYITPISGIFSLFTDCYYTRWAYALTLAFVICTLYYIRDYGFPSLRSVVWYCVTVYGFFFLFCGASICWQYFRSGNDSMAGPVKLALDAILVAVNTMTLLILCKKKHEIGHRFSSTVIAIVICSSFQLFVFTAPGLKGFPVDNSDMTENEYFVRGGDFRIDGDFSHRTNFKVLYPTGGTYFNFGLICNRPSISTFHSVQNNHIYNWESIVSEKFNSKRLFYPGKFVESFEALMSVKDLVMIANETVDSIAKKTIIRDGLFSLYESDHYIPMGFTYDRYVISDSVLTIASRDSTFDVPKVLLSAIAINKEDEAELSSYMKKGQIDGNQRLDSLVAIRRVTSCDSFIGHTRGFDAHIKLDSAAVVFFSVVADPGFKACIDGVPTKIYETNLGFSSVIVPAGNHEIIFRYFPIGFKLGLIISVIGLSLIGLMFYKRQ